MRLTKSFPVSKKCRFSKAVAHVISSLSYFTWFSYSPFYVQVTTSQTSAIVQYQQPSWSIYLPSCAVYCRHGLRDLSHFAATWYNNMLLSLPDPPLLAYCLPGCAKLVSLTDMLLITSWFSFCWQGCRITAVLLPPPSVTMTLPFS